MVAGSGFTNSYQNPIRYRAKQSTWVVMERQGWRKFLTERLGAIYSRRCDALSLSLRYRHGLRQHHKF